MKRLISVLLIVVMSLSLSISSLGAVASSSDAIRVASPSSAVKFQSSLLSDLGISLFQSSDLQYGVDWFYTAHYSDSSGYSHPVDLTLQSDGSYSATAPGTYDFYRITLYLDDSCFPSPGTYGFSYSINQGHIDYVISSLEAQFYLSASNVEGLYPDSQDLSYSNDGQRYYGSFNIEIPSRAKSFQLVFMLENYEHSVSLGSASWSFSFRENSGPVVDDGLDTNIDQDISNSVDNISSGVSDLNSGISDVNDSLREIVQTISLQLEALWNQLYNYMHVPQLANDDKNTGLITDSIDTMGSDVVDSVDSAASDITSNADSNAQAIQDNADQNTNTITNGYDNSGIDSDNDRLSDKLDEYGQQEDELMEDVSDGLSGIDFDVDFDSILSSIQLTSDFLQDLYDASGGFKLVINCALLLSFASCAVGLYRLKGGG